MWTKERLELLKATIAKGLNDNQFSLFVEVCKMRNLNPFAKQIYAVVRQGNMVIQTSIDGYRLIAERTGKYLGQTSPEWCGKDGVWRDVWTNKENPFACRIGVFKAGHSVPTIGIAYWDTYVAPGPFWSKAGPHMLSKCSEGLALKKAFPEELSGLYTNDEMDQANDTMVTPVNVAVVEAEEVQPVMTFPTKILATNSSGMLVQDTNGVEWVYPTSSANALNEAIGNSNFLLVYYTVETGRRIVTGLGAIQGGQ